LYYDDQLSLKGSRKQFTVETKSNKRKIQSTEVMKTITNPFWGEHLNGLLIMQDADNAERWKWGILTGQTILLCIRESQTQRGEEKSQRGRNPKNRYGEH